jgi:hypothetical protein
MSSKWRYEEKVEDRNYDQEARELIKPLSLSQQYELYGIAHKQTQRSCSDKRMKELVAVKKAIEGSPMIDKYKLNFILNGYKTEMAAQGKPKDGAKKPWRKQS